LVIQKHGTRKVIFKDFTTPPFRPNINASQLEKMCRADILGDVIHV
jgi:hypothetical protein